VLKREIIVSADGIDRTLRQLRWGVHLGHLLRGPALTTLRKSPN
jgi:hypothetical protein